MTPDESLRAALQLLEAGQLARLELVRRCRAAYDRGGTEALLEELTTFASFAQRSDGDIDRVLAAVRRLVAARADAS